MLGEEVGQELGDGFRLLNGNHMPLILDDLETGVGDPFGKRLVLLDR